MRYIKSFIVFISVMAFFNSLSAQETESKSDTENIIKSQKIAFFTDKIGLSPEEAQVFWPIYNDYWDKKNTIIIYTRQRRRIF